MLLRNLSTLIFNLFHPLFGTFIHCRHSIPGKGITFKAFLASHHLSSELLV